MLERSSGEHTYFASDIAYHAGQARARLRPPDRRLGRRPPRLRRRACARPAQALGGDPDALELLIMQFVHLVERGERASMSKRAGEFVTLDDLVDDIGVDAARWFLLQRSHDTTIDLDLDLAREQSAREPRLLRAVRARADRGRCCARRARSASPRRWSRAGRCRPAWPAPVRAGAGQEAAGLARRGRRGGRPPRAPPDRDLRARARAGLHRLLPRLPGRRRRAERARGLPARARASPPQRTIARALDLLGVDARRTRCRTPAGSS